MSIEKNKQVIREYFDCLNDLNVDRLEELFADDFIWIVPVRAKSLAHLNFPRDKEQSVDRIRTIFSGMDKKPTFKILSMTAEEDRVHAESDGLMYWHNGVAMDNQYHHAFVLRDGKITKCTEYCDFLAIKESDPMVTEDIVETSKSK
ncbi:MAG TPA: nuclear transport factor 2 family protein [Solirubrobacteraceae bacterium]|jgi:ketosteroid isomerase-like protein|nr:nuclear transport factor 2 family protein [Solirubrobacteraceae bacterium]